MNYEPAFNIFREFNSLFGFNDQNDFKSRAPMIADALNEMFISLQQAEAQELKLLFLAKNLRVIQTHDKKLFKDFKRKLLNDSKNDNFHGTRFEVAISASFIQKNISFTKGESPDFTIPESRIGVEATSVRIRSEELKSDYSYKLETAIRNKLNKKKKYLDKNSVLLIDGTNLYHTSSQVITDNSDHDLFLNKIKETIDKEDIGAVVLFNYVLDSQNGRYVGIYSRVDNTGIDPRLYSFLNLHYPKGNMTLHNVGIPHENI